MSNEKYIVGIDVGTTKIFTIVSRVIDETLEIVGVGKAPSRGLRKSIVVDIDATVNSIKESVEDAERSSGIKIKEVFVGIAGEHIKSFGSTGAVGILDGVVKQKDIDRVMESAKAVYVPLDKEILHIIPVEYAVDGETEILNPLGMSGVRLEINVQIVTGSVTSVQNLLKCCEKAGLEVLEIILEPLASAMSTLSEDEKEYGAILVDIGGGTTDITIFKNNTFIDTTILGIGGNHFTNDIAVTLRLPTTEAERIKKAYGKVYPDEEADKEEIAVMVANRDEKNISRKFLTEILAPRSEELLKMIRQEISRMSGYELAPYGVVLTGGASQLSGIDKMAETMLQLPIRLGKPEDDRFADSVKNPIYSTSVGMMLYAKEHTPQKITSPDAVSQMIGKMKGLFKNFLKK